MESKLLIILVLISFSFELDTSYTNESCNNKEVPADRIKISDKYSYCESLEPSTGQVCVLYASKKTYESTTKFICISKELNPLTFEQYLNDEMSSDKEITYANITYKVKEELQTVQAGSKWNRCINMNKFNPLLSDVDCMNGISELTGFQCCYLKIKEKDKDAQKTCLFSNLNQKEVIIENIEKDAKQKNITLESIVIDCENNTQSSCNEVEDSYTRLSVGQCGSHSVKTKGNKCCRVKKYMPNPRVNETYTCREYSYDDINETRKEVEKDLNSQTEYTKYSAKCEEDGEEIEVGDASITCSTISSYITNVTNTDCWNASVINDLYKCCRIHTTLKVPDGERDDNICLSMMPIYEKNAESQLKNSYRALGYEILHLDIHCPKGSKEEQEQNLRCVNLTSVNNLNQENCFNTKTADNESNCCFIDAEKKIGTSSYQTINTCVESRELEVVQTKENMIKLIESTGGEVTKIEISCPKFGEERWIKQTWNYMILFMVVILGL